VLGDQVIVFFPFQAVLDMAARHRAVTAVMINLIPVDLIDHRTLLHTEIRARPTFGQDIRNQEQQAGE